MRALFDDIDLKSFKQVMDVNFYGTVYCTKFALPYLIKSKGSLVGIISVAGHVGLPARTAYSASKFAVRGFSGHHSFGKSCIPVFTYLVAAPGFTYLRNKKKSFDGRWDTTG